MDRKRNILRTVLIVTSGILILLICPFCIGGGRINATNSNPFRGYSIDEVKDMYRTCAKKCDCDTAECDESIMKSVDCLAAYGFSGCGTNWWIRDRLSCFKPCEFEILPVKRRELKCKSFLNIF